MAIFAKLSTFAFITCLLFISVFSTQTSLAQAIGTNGCHSAACVDLNSADYDAPTFVSLANYSRSPSLAQAYRTVGLSPLLNSAFSITLSIGAILAVLRIVYGGYIYMGSADMWGNKQKAKEIVGDAFIGLVLLFGIYLILYQINPNLLNLDILKDVKQAKTPASADNNAGTPAVSGNTYVNPSSGTNETCVSSYNGVCVQFSNMN